MCELNQLLTKLNACSDAKAWAAGKTLEQAWQECQRPDWMLWLLGQSAVNKKVIVTIAVEFAEQCVSNASAYPAVAQCIAVVKRFLNGEAGPEELSAARSAAWSAAWSAASAALSAAESAARSAAWSARSAARSAESAARSAAWSAESAAWSAAESAAWSAAESAASEIVRKHVPTSTISSLFEPRG
jgi:hypothetical protein